MYADICISGFCDTYHILGLVLPLDKVIVRLQLTGEGQKGAILSNFLI
jgi:hypothetical protein